MSYVIAPLDKVKGENAYPEFLGVVKDLEQATIARAREIWPGFSMGGLIPGDNQYGITTPRMNEMANDVNATTLSGSYPFRKNYGGTGWRPVFSYSVREDVIHAFAGFLVTDEVLRVLQFRIELSDKLYPIIDVQEAKAWGGFAILFKTDKGKELIAPPRSRVLVRAYLETTGYQTIVPLGFELFKRKDLVITET